VRHPSQSGISLLPPRPPRGTAHRLPPMLRSHGSHTMASCSKAPRGLFVLLWVHGVLTVTAVSPSPWSRHCPDRDAFRAGRNLPDKEFRYLRTVIVTAAVHRGFSSVLAHLPLTFRHWAGISPYTSSFDFSRDLWFCYPVAWASFVPLGSARAAKAVTAPRLPSTEGTGVNCRVP
jgi:hypothetical protein